MARTLVQPGSGSTRDIALCYLSGGKQAAPALGPDVCVVQETADAYDRVGDGGVADWQDTVSWAAEQAGGFSPGKVWLIGFSAGCQGVRTQIIQGCKADYVFALDGIHLPLSGTPQDYKTAPWLATKQRADAGDCVFFCSYSNTAAYNNKTVRASLQQLFGIDPECFGSTTEPCVQGSGNFLIFGATQSGSGTPATEHTSQVNDLLPAIIPVALGKRTLGGRRGAMFWIVGLAAALLGAWYFDLLQPVAVAQQDDVAVIDQLLQVEGHGFPGELPLGSVVLESAELQATVLPDVAEQVVLGLTLGGERADVGSVPFPRILVVRLDHLQGMEPGARRAPIRQPAALSRRQRVRQLDGAWLVEPSAESRWPGRQLGLPLLVVVSAPRPVPAVLVAVATAEPVPIGQGALAPGLLAHRVVRPLGPRPPGLAAPVAEASPPPSVDRQGGGAGLADAGWPGLSDELAAHGDKSPVPKRAQAPMTKAPPITTW